MPVDLRTAATVLVLRDGARGPDVFMVRRHDRAVFMAGAHVFPGGVVDVSDGDASYSRCCDGIDRAAAQLPDLPLAGALALHVAAVRELFEEAGVLLARDASGGFARLDDDRFGQYRQDLHSGVRTLRDVLEREDLRLAADALVVCAHWVTPPIGTRRFDTRFFAARLPAHQNPTHDDRETSDGYWTDARSTIGAANRGEIVLAPPTWVMLHELEPFQSVEEVLTWARGLKVRRREPALVQHEGSKVLVMTGDPSQAQPGQGVAPAEMRFIWAKDQWRPEKDGMME